jgi:succinylglutamic semialdehyde dehydrogenase
MNCEGKMGTSENWYSGQGKEWISRDPATKEVLGNGYEASMDQVDNAIQLSHNTFKTWSKTPIKLRIQYVSKFAEILKENKSELAELISMETGKMLWESEQEIGAMISKACLSIQAYQERCLVKYLTIDPQTQNITRYRAIGPMVVFGPFNFPGHLPNGHIIPALIAGNTVIFKPAEQTPLVGEYVCKLWERVGLPTGVIGLIQGGMEVGKQLTNSNLIGGILFTGSSITGKKIHKALAGKPHIMLALEMGGNNPLIIGKISSPSAAAYQTIISSYLTSGQRCVCARRLIVVKNNNTKEFVKTLISMIAKIKTGYWNDVPSPFMGPLISDESANYVHTKYEALVEKRAVALVPMFQSQQNLSLLSPALLDVNKVEKLVDEEIFGPLLQLKYVDSIEDALDEANQTEYGLSAGIFSHDKYEIKYFQDSIRAGIVNVNCPLTGASSAAPFGGIGLSGNMRPSGYFAADYCSYPVASMESEDLDLPEKLSPGIER